MSIWEPKEDGITHINIYSKSALPLGRALSNFFASTFIHPKYGKFKSVEGFYYWLLTGKIFNELKELVGYEAKKFGESKEPAIKRDKKFKEEIQEAIGLKIIQNDYIQNLLIKSSLPFAHYYYYGDKDKKPVVYYKEKEHHYIIEAVEQIRKELKENGKFL
jgi:hypothetical protein